MALESLLRFELPLLVPVPYSAASKHFGLDVALIDSYDWYITTMVFSPTAQVSSEGGSGSLCERKPQWYLENESQRVHSRVDVKRFTDSIITRPYDPFAGGVYPLQSLFSYALGAGHNS